jgi:hypothetical protein
VIALEIGTGVVFRVHDALTPVPDRSHVWMDTKNQSTIWFSPVQRHGKNTLLTLMADHNYSEHIHGSESILPDECDNGLNVDTHFHTQNKDGDPHEPPSVPLKHHPWWDIHIT